MNIIQARVTVERLLASLEQRDPQTRQKLHTALMDAQREGGRQMWLLLASAVVAAGGTLVIPAAALRTRADDMGFTIEENWQTGDITVKLGGVDPELLQALRAAGVVKSGQPVEIQELAVGPNVQSPAPAADQAEAPELAAVRIASALKNFLLQHYAGELHTRGRAFTVGVFAGLHAESIGVGLTHDAREVDAGGPTFDDLLDAHLASVADRLRPLAVAAHELTELCATAHPGASGVSLH